MKNVVQKYPDHAFGHLYMSRCYQGTGESALAQEHATTALEIFERDAWWRDLAARYDVDIPALLSFHLRQMAPSEIAAVSHLSATA